MSRPLESTLNNSFKIAHILGHAEVTAEHLLMALFNDAIVGQLLSDLSIDVSALKRDIFRVLREHYPQTEAGKISRVRPSESFSRVLKRVAENQAKSSEYEEGFLNQIDTISLLLASMEEISPDVLSILYGFGLSARRVEHIRSKWLTQGGPASFEERQKNAQSEQESEEEVEEGEKDPLELYTIDLTEKAKQGKIDPLVGREEEVMRLCQILCRRKKSNPLIVGEPGVGKTAVVEGLVSLIEKGDIAPSLRGFKIHMLDTGALLAGTKYRGDFENRMGQLVKRLKSLPKVILFVDEIHMLIGAGATSGGTMDASNLLKPILSGGEIRLIGATTYKEYQTVMEKDGAFTRRFQKLELKEPSVEEVFKILHQVKSLYESFHQVRYSDDAIAAIVDYSNRLIHDRYYPDKALDLMDEVGANESASREKGEEVRVKRLGMKQVAAVVSRVARVPLGRVLSDERTRLLNLEKSLGDKIFGQEEAMSKLSRAILVSRSGLGALEKPTGSFLFVGPTGVGKTETVKQLSSIMGMELLRFDMSEYMERHAMARLIGSPPGYVGFEQAGKLTNAVLKNPYSIILFDEIEKAHPDISNLFLQIMDHGTLTDGNGRPVDFKNTIIVFTTNLGAQDAARENLGFKEQDHTKDMLKAVEKFFSPELRNRLDAVVQFNSLGREQMDSVVQRQLSLFSSQLEKQQASLEVTEKAKAYLALKGYDAKMGARHLERLIYQEVRWPLANLILAKKAKVEQTFVLDFDGEKTHIMPKKEVAFLGGKKKKKSNKRSKAKP